MMRSAQRVDNNELAVEHSAEHFTFVKFLKRYPIFLLAFGPPIFRSSAGIDATQGNIDFWAILQVGLLVAVSFRAIIRLTKAESIFISRRAQSILKYAFFLGLLYLASAAYSPSHFASTAYAILYFLTWICITEFLADVYKNPPNWTQCIFHLRWIAFLLLVVILLTLFFKPSLVMEYQPGIGIRMGGAAVAPMGTISPVIAILSAYTFLYSLEPKRRAAFFFFIGFAGTILTQSRGSELALLLCLAIIGFGWAKTGRRSAYIAISGFMALTLLFGVVIGFAGERLWNTFNRGQSVEGIKSASGRTDIWNFVIHYCMSHPQGMGYASGFRLLFRDYHASGLQVEASHIGNTHNAFMEVLADAGWLALAAYFIMMVKISALGIRFASKHVSATLLSNSMPVHLLRCAVVLLILCLAEGMEASEFTFPLKAVFYMQNIFIAIILGTSCEMLSASRAQPASLPR